jgi:hypothetical protein
MKTVDNVNDLLFTDLTIEEESSASGGWFDRYLPSGVFFTVPGTDNKYYFGDYNNKPSEWEGAKWGIRINGETAAKGYYRTFGW